MHVCVCVCRMHVSLSLSLSPLSLPVSRLGSTHGMYVSICPCMYVHMCVCDMCVYICVCVCMYVCTYACVYRGGGREEGEPSLAGIGVAKAVGVGVAARHPLH
jgi:hypothetical protein